MRVILVLAVMAFGLLLSGCSPKNKEVYAKRPSSKLQEAVLVKTPSPSFSKVSKQAASKKAQPLPAPSPLKVIALETPPAPARKPQPPPRESRDASTLHDATGKHYVVVDTVGNCTVIDSPFPSAGLAIIGNRGGYTSAESANEALRNLRAKCKEVAGSETEDELDAARNKAQERGGVHALTPEDIEGLSQEQLKQLRGY